MSPLLQHVHYGNSDSVPADAPTRMKKFSVFFWFHSNGLIVDLRHVVNNPVSSDADSGIIIQVGGRLSDTTDDNKITIFVPFPKSNYYYLFK